MLVICVIDCFGPLLYTSCILGWHIIMSLNKKLKKKLGAFNILHTMMWGFLNSHVVARHLMDHQKNSVKNKEENMSLSQSLNEDIEIWQCFNVN